jgi:hypothetical protein
MVEPHRVAAVIFSVETIATPGDITKYQCPPVVGYEQAIDTLAY